MLRDVFYYGMKPNVHPRERYAENLEHARSMSTTEHFWIINEFCDYRNFDWDFDFDFLPDEEIWTAKHNNVWPSQHQKDSGTWLCATEYSDIIVYRADVDPVRRKNIKHDAWVLLEEIDETKFDFSWHPDPTSPPYIYKFGTSYRPPELMTLVEYRVLGATDAKYMYNPIVTLKEINKYYIETTLEDLINKHENEIFWALSKNVDYDKFNFDWRPDSYQSNLVHVFGQSEDISKQTYYVNGILYAKGFKEFNFIEEQVKKSIDELDMFYVDRGNQESHARFETLKTKFPHIQKTRYLNSWVDTITRCTNRATSNLVWVLNSELDYSNFNFDYYPNPWQMKMVHMFGTQWNHWGTTFLVNRETFAYDTKYVKVIEHLSNLNFVKDIRAVATKCIHDIILIDHGNSETDSVVELLKKKAGDKNVITFKYDTSYLKTLSNIIASQIERKEHYIWICSSVCDYTNFDFSYICDPYAKDQLHVFPTGKQKFGDTFFIDVNKARELINELKSLEEYQQVNYNATMRVPRLPEPVIVTTDDTLVDVATRIDNWPYATVMTDDNKDIETVDVEPMNLWSSETKNIIVTSTGSTRLIVPREVKDYVKKELYDYPYIKESARLAKSNPLDIVFLSNGETCADENYEHLLNVTKGLKNRVVRVDGVNGRVQAYHAVAEASNTPWVFTVFAKLKVNDKFDWNWQPDRMQVAKHYIFQAKNPLNGLVYGHQAMIAYNKKLTLANQGLGLDFTLDDEHEVVDLLSGTAMYNTDSFTTWRTAFREVLKLRDENSVIAQERIDKWVNVAEGDFAEYSIKGAVDALAFYDEVNGDFNELKKSYEWAWLRDRFNKL